MPGLDLEAQPVPETNIWMTAARTIIGAIVIFLVFGLAPLVAWFLGSDWPLIWALLTPSVIVWLGLAWIVGKAIVP